MSMDIESLWDDSERVVRYTQSGIRTVRPYTPEENAAADARAAQAAALAQREATRTAVRAIVDDLQAEKARAQAVLDKANGTLGPGDTKDVARAVKRIADAAIDLARFVRDV